MPKRDVFPTFFVFQVDPRDRKLKYYRISHPAQSPKGPEDDHRFIDGMRAFSLVKNDNEANDVCKIQAAKPDHEIEEDIIWVVTGVFVIGDLPDVVKLFAFKGEEFLIQSNIKYDPHM